MAQKTQRIKRKTYYSLKIKKAAQLLFFKRHREPGVKGWELRRKLGSEYPSILKLLDEHLARLGLTVKTVYENEQNILEKATPSQLDKAKFYISLRDGLSTDERLIGWRIDDLAGLAVSIGFILSNEGKIPRKDLEEILLVKLSNWRTNININRFLRQGYLIEDEKGNLSLGWRTRAEVNYRKLVDLLLNS